MQPTHNVTPLNRIPVFQRFVDVDEDIHQILTLHSLSLYMTFRFQAQFGHDSSRIKRTARETYTKAKISRSQYFKSVNELEEVGLIKRDPTSKLGEEAAIYIARHLWHFQPQLAPKPVVIGGFEEPVSDVDGPIHNMDTLKISNS